VGLRVSGEQYTLADDAQCSAESKVIMPKIFSFFSFFKFSLLGQDNENNKNQNQKPKVSTGNNLLR
jgi:hypothetical protein